MSTNNRYLWQHKDLLGTEQLSREDVVHLLDLAESFSEINQRPVRKVPTLQGRTIILFFVENSTRTKTSFDVAGKRLSADTHALSQTGSSLNKGESLLDTGLTLQAMNPDVIVVRHSSSGAAQFLAE
ncbi:MAG: aspartate carbamoyltransferase, partial [Desulfovibrio sp.]|nr:aspartate carbamoyltransferase [Desulfovibrio sp.]